MITTKYIDNEKDILALIAEQQEYDSNVSRYRGEYVYRGERNENFIMSTTLRRNCKEREKELEGALLRNYAKYASSENPIVEESVWHQMILGQHHGLPTRLLDWTHSPLIAMHFGCSVHNMDDMTKHDAVIWRLDMQEIHSLLPPRYQEILKREQTSVFTVNMIRELVGNDLAQYDADMQDRSMVIIEPPSLDKRIISQFSFFSVVPCGMDIETFLNTYTDNTVRYVIDRKMRWYVRDLLDQLNISERTIYPGLDGVAAWLARHYFVQSEMKFKK